MRTDKVDVTEVVTSASHSKRMDSDPGDQLSSNAPPANSVSSTESNSAPSSLIPSTGSHGGSKDDSFAQLIVNTTKSTTKTPQLSPWSIDYSNSPSLSPTDDHPPPSTPPSSREPSTGSHKSTNDHLPPNPGGSWTYFRGATKFRV